MSEAAMKDAITNYIDADKKYLDLIQQIISLPGKKDGPIISKDDLTRIRQAKELRDKAEEQMHDVIEQELRER